MNSPAWSSKVCTTASKAGISELEREVRAFAMEFLILSTMAGSVSSPLVINFASRLDM